MKRLTSIFAATGSALALAFVTPVHAQETAPRAAAQEAPARAATPALWKVADEDTTIYLFGTIHALPEGVDWYTGPVKQAVEGADTLVTEVNMSPEALAGLQTIVRSTAMLPQGTTLRGLMDDDQRAAYESGLAGIGVPAQALDPFKPWFAALQIANVAYAKSGMTPGRGVDTTLETLAGPDTGRDALETVEYQLGIFDSLPQDVQMQYLLESLDEFGDIGPLMARMTDRWETGDVDGLAAALNETLKEDPVLAERLLYVRNANWAKWIETRLETPGTVLMAVGAGHLAGPRSVQEELAGMGIETQRVQ